MVVADVAGEVAAGPGEVLRVRHRQSASARPYEVLYFDQLLSEWRFGKAARSPLPPRFLNSRPCDPSMTAAGTTVSPMESSSSSSLARPEASAWLAGSQADRTITPDIGPTLSGQHSLKSAARQALGHRAGSILGVGI